MLQLIEEKLSRNVCDDVMEVAWSTMWNVTDETALNCKRFLKHSGMQFFLNCLEVLKHSLLVNEFIVNVIILHTGISKPPRATS